MLASDFNEHLHLWPFIVYYGIAIKFYFVQIFFLWKNIFFFCKNYFGLIINQLHLNWIIVCNVGVILQHHHSHLQINLFHMYFDNIFTFLCVCVFMFVLCVMFGAGAMKASWLFTVAELCLVYYFRFPHKLTCVRDNVLCHVGVVCYRIHERQGVVTLWLCSALFTVVVCGFLTVPLCTIRRFHSERKKKTVWRSQKELGNAPVLESTTGVSEKHLQKTLLLCADIIFHNEEKKTPDGKLNLVTHMIQT